MKATSREDAMRKAALSLKIFCDSTEHRKNDQLDYDVMNRAKVIDATPEGKVILEIDLNHRYANGGGTLHGGAAAVLFDVYSATAFAPLLPDWTPELQSQSPPGGVSRSLNVSFLRPVPLPVRVRIMAEVVSNGKVATMVRARMTTPDQKKIYATCEHHKIQIAVPGQASKDGWVKARL